MQAWFVNDKVGIFFDSVPQIGVRYALPSMSKEERKSIEKYPFICKKELSVILADYIKQKTYKFTVPKGYCYDGASIPRLFWRIVGPNTDNRFLIPALIHDVLCENHSYVDNDRSFSTNIFDALLESAGISKYQRFFMKNSVGLFQSVACKW